MRGKQWQCFVHACSLTLIQPSAATHRPEGGIHSSNTCSCPAATKRRRTTKRKSSCCQTPRTISKGFNNRYLTRTGQKAHRQGAQLGGRHAGLPAVEQGVPQAPWEGAQAVAADEVEGDQHEADGDDAGAGAHEYADPHRVRQLLGRRVKRCQRTVKEVVPIRLGTLLESELGRIPKAEGKAALAGSGTGRISKWASAHKM